MSGTVEPGHDRGKLIDSHCHLDLPAFDADRAEVVARARAAGVTGILVPAIRPATWDALIGLAAAHDLDVALGVHPQIVPELDDAERALAVDADALAAAIAAHPGIAAVGECGLDGGTAEPALQERILRAHLRAARALDLPVVLHVLRAHDAAPRILREEGPVTGVMHSYSGGADLVGVYAGLGLAFSLAGPVTYPNARRPIEAARAIPADLLLAETDAPDQAPAPWRGGRCEPAMVTEVVAGLAAARGEPVDAIAKITADNTRRILRMRR
jgi:TatD DNase family protein